MTSEHAGVGLQLEHKREAENRNGGKKGREGKSRGGSEWKGKYLPPSLPPSPHRLPLPHVASNESPNDWGGGGDPAEGRESFRVIAVFTKKKFFPSVEMRCQRRRDFLWGWGRAWRGCGPIFSRWPPADAIFALSALNAEGAPLAGSQSEMESARTHSRTSLTNCHPPRED